VVKDGRSAQKKNRRESVSPLGTEREAVVELNAAAVGKRRNKRKKKCGGKGAGKEVNFKQEKVRSFHYGGEGKKSHSWRRSGQFD